MNYTDEQYKDATQIAYITFLQEANDILGDKENGDHYTIAELVSAYLDLDEARAIREANEPGRHYDDPIEELKSLIYFSPIDYENKKTLLNISNESYNWKYITSYDNNHYSKKFPKPTGFYGCALDTTNGTEKGDLMIAFRGSETLEDYEQDWLDWIKSDLGLLLGKTPQHEDVEKFTEILKAEGVFDQYSDREINVAGHSLGGNLAAYFTMYTCENEREIFDRIGQCYNEDGPGFIKRFFDEHEPYVSEACKKIVHYKASFVGNLLYSHPNETVKYVHIDDKKIMKNTRVEQKLYRHDTLNWEYDKEGKLTFDDEPDELGSETGAISHIIEDSGLGPLLYPFLVFTFKYILEEGKDGKSQINKMGALQYLMILGTLISSTVLINPVLPATIITSIVSLIAITIAVILIDRPDLKEKIEEIITSIADNLKKISTDTANLLTTTFKNIVEYIMNNKEALMTSVNIGYSYASQNPVIQLETDKLRNCANRIDKVNQRLSSLDNRVKALYYNIGLVDIWNILNADLNISYNNTLKRCSNYLYETANDFEQVERNIESAF